MRVLLSRCVFFALLVLTVVPCLFPIRNVSAAFSQSTPQQIGENQQTGQGYTLPPDRAEKAIAYARARRGLYFAEIFYEAIVLLLFLHWRLGPALRDWAERAASRRFVQALIFAPAFQLTFALLTLPGSVAGHWLARSYEQSVQSWNSWFWDWSKSQALALVVGTC